MKETILIFLENFWLLLTSIAFFILLGLIFASLLKQFLPESYIRKHLGKHSFMANIKAAILGIPLPLCSCSVIPFISSLKQSGASKSAIQTFLISTPITGVDSILATYAVFGWFFTLFRLISSVVISLIAGLLSLLFIPESTQNETKPPLSLDTISITTTSVKPDSFANFIDRFEHSFNEVFGAIAQSLLIGIIIGAFIITLLPEDFSTMISQNSWLNYLLILLISAPLYVCATASIPLGLSLLAAGFSPGAVFIFLTAGPATNTVTMSVVKNALGGRSLLIYLLSVVIGSLLFGLTMDILFAETLQNVIQQTLEKEQLGFVEQVSAVILLYMALKFSFGKKTPETSGCNNSCGCG